MHQRGKPWDFTGYGSGSANEGRGFAEFADYRSCVLTTLTALTGHAKQRPDIGQFGFSATTSFADLLVGNLSADTDVHARFLGSEESKS